MLLGHETTRLSLTSSVQDDRVILLADASVNRDIDLVRSRALACVWQLLVLKRVSLLPAYCPSLRVRREYGALPKTEAV